VAGTRTGDFVEIVSPFLREKLRELTGEYGWASREVQAIARQYVKSAREYDVNASERRRHYESEVRVAFEGQPVHGVERLYRRTVLIEPTTVCASHCRWCLRGQYPVQTLTKEQIIHAARYAGSASLRDDVTEVLITGGDPLMSLPLLGFTVSELARHATNVSVVRVGTRLPFQDPARVNAAMVELFGRYPQFRFELGVNVATATEFWPESVAAVRRLQSIGIRFYNQHPLLRGVNDDVESLVALGDAMRATDIEAHYIFHAIPLRGMGHHRTSLNRGAQLVARVSSSGTFSGRAKPRFTVLSDIGKITMYEGVIAGYRPGTNEVLLRSGYRLSDRMRWSPGWEVPPGVEIDGEGYLQTWYLDCDESAHVTDLIPRGEVERLL
jgi:lysine 2,3-aminomutase